MTDWTKQSKAELYEHAVSVGANVSRSMTKAEIYHATVARLRQQISDIEDADDSEDTDDPTVMFVPDRDVARPMAALPAVALVREAEASVALDGETRSFLDVDDDMDEWRAGTGLVERASTLPELSRWDQMRAMAAVLCRSPLMPRHIRESADPEANCLVILLTAHDLGLTATLAIWKIGVIEGTPTLAAELQRMLVRRDGHDLKINVRKDDRGDPVEAEVLINRKEWANDDWRGATFDLADAVRMELCKVTEDGKVRARSKYGKALPWETATEDMLVARATSRACRRYAEDCLGGISYTPDELGTIDAEPADDYDRAVEPVPPKLISAEQRQTVIDAIDKLPTAQRDWLRAAWKESGLASALHDGPLTEHWLSKVSGMLAEAVQQPVDAEVVAEQPPCETDADEPTDKEVDGVPDRGGVQTAADMRAASAAALERARTKYEDGICPDCGKTSAANNLDCPTHPF